MSGSLLSPWARIISSDLIIDELSKQMACHLTDKNEATIAANASYPNKDISDCLSEFPSTRCNTNNKGKTMSINVNDFFFSQLTIRGKCFTIIS